MLHVCTERRHAQTPQGLLLGVPQPGRAADRAIAPRGLQWPNGSVLPVAFLGGTATQQSMVRSIAVQWSSFANIRFEFITDPMRAKIRVSFDPNDGAWSYMGTENLLIPAPQATMNLGWLDQAVILHEFGHAISLAHEHQNPEGGIQWNEAQVIRDLSGPPNNWSEATIRHNVLNKYRMDQINGTTFDAASIMLYSFPASWTTNGFSAPWNTVLSAMDKQFVGSTKMYPGAVAPEPKVLSVHPVDRGEISVPNERDLYAFDVASPGDYLIETGGTLDTYMMLFGPNDRTTLVAKNDDGGRGANARIEATLGTGRYYLQVRAYGANSVGKYTVAVTGG